eukprot:m.33025 g.33025  ORF g.33025 m.33025 type:complete len:719 (-) comp16747_c0_seq1:423-2579(-)
MMSDVPPSKRARTDDLQGKQDKRVPDRWHFCPRKGNSIVWTDEDKKEGFLPFKAPLDERYDAVVQPGERWDPPMLTAIASLRNIGLVIDLTKSYRYYDAANLSEQASLEVVRLECEGHEGAPTEEQSNRFIETCEKYWKEHPGTVIGVHCTHGFNRTGFMICSYLSKFQSIEQAIFNFSEARPPGIYKEEYVRTLIERSDESELLEEPDTIVALLPNVMPSWNLGPDEYCEMLEDIRSITTGKDDYELEEAETVLIAAKLTEVLAKMGDAALEETLVKVGWSFEERQFTDGVLSEVKALDDTLSELISSREPYLSVATHKESDESARAVASDKAEFAIADERIEICQPPQLGLLRKMCRELVGASRGKGFPGAQPVSLDGENLQGLTLEKHWCSWKADGTRYLLLVHDGWSYMVGRDNTVFNIKTNLWLPTGEVDKATGKPKLDPATKKPLVHKRALLDGELVIDKYKDKRGVERKRPRFLAYDLIVLGNQGFHNNPYGHRLHVLKHAVVEPRIRMKHTCLDDLGRIEPFSFRFKPFYPIHSATLSKLLKFKETLQHEDDGWIFAKDSEPYRAGTCHSLLKFKPPEDNTIDFMVRVSSEPGLVVARLMAGGQGGQEVEFGIDGNSVIKASTTLPARANRLKSFDGKIVEMAWRRDDKGKASWCPLRIRKDKSHPNHITTCEKVVGSIKANITADRIITMFRQHEAKEAQQAGFDLGRP